MKRVIAMIHYMILLLLPVLIFTSGCENTDDMASSENVYPQEMPNDFNFRVTYGTYGKNQVDTFNDTIVKDLVTDGTIEATIPLTESDMNEIYKQMIEMDIMGELVLEEDEDCMVEPPSYTEWTIQMDGETQHFSYEDFCDFPEDVTHLKAIQDSIHETVSQKDDYQALPDSNGFYE